MCTDYVYEGVNVCIGLSVCSRVCGQSEENESTGRSFIHSPLKQYCRSMTNQIRNGWKRRIVILVKAGNRSRLCNKYQNSLD